MTAAYFLAFLAFMAVLVMILISRYLPSRNATTGVFVWIAYVGLLSYFGVVRNPPGILLIVAPVFLFVALALVRSPRGGRIALAFPLPLILGLQTFRVGVELLLHRLWTDGLVPKLMTYEGGNFDILIGLSAPVIAWIALRNRTGLFIAMAWSYLGLASLANIIIRSALTAPGPMHLIHSEIPNLAIGTFPFTFIAGFFAPLAVILHVLAIRALGSRMIALENANSHHTTESAGLRRSGLRPTHQRRTGSHSLQRARDYR